MIYGYWAAFIFLKLFVQGNLQISIYRKPDVLPMLYQDTSQFLLLFIFRIYNVNPATVLAFQFFLEQALHSASADYTIGCITFSCMFL